MPVILRVSVLPKGEDQASVGRDIDQSIKGARPIQIGTGTDKKKGKVIAAARDRQFPPDRHIATIAIRRGEMFVFPSRDGKPSRIEPKQEFDLGDCTVSWQTVDLK